MSLFLNGSLYCVCTVFNKNIIRSIVIHIPFITSKSDDSEPQRVLHGFAQHIFGEADSNPAKLPVNPMKCNGLVFQHSSNRLTRESDWKY